MSNLINGCFEFGVFVMEGKIKKNLVYNVCYQLLVIILPFITAPYVSRVLGAYNIGIYSYTQALANYFYLFVMLGVINYGNRTIAAIRDDRNTLDKTFWEIYSFQLLVGLFVTALYFIYCIFYVKENRLIYCMQFFYVASGIFDVNWLCFGLEKFKLTTIRSVIVRLGMVFAIFLFVKDQSDLSIYTGILSVGSLLAVLAVWPFVLSNVNFRRPSLTGIVKHIKPNLVLFLPVVAVSLYNIMDKLMLGSFSTEEEVGFYTYAERITQIPNTIILALNSVLMPRMANLYAKNDTIKTRNMMDNIMLFAMFMSVLMAFILARIAPNFAPWFYGDEFARCGLFIVILCPIIIFKGWAGVLRTQYIIPKGKDRVFITSLTIGAVVNLIINYCLIPKYSGIGAVVGTLFAEFAVCLVQFTMIYKEIPFKIYLKDGLAFCCMGLVMYNAVLYIEYLNVSPFFTMVIQIVIGTILFTILAVFYCIKVKGINVRNKILYELKK